MLNLLAMAIGTAAGYLPHLLFGRHLSFFADFMTGTVTGGAAYIYALYKLKQMRGDF
jgi:hypothetical protein